MSATDLDDTFNAPPPLPSVAPTRDDILGSLRWGKPAEVVTKKGPRIRTSAAATQAAHDLFAREGNELRALGYTRGEWPVASGKWSVTRWEMVPEKIIVQRQESKLASRAVDADINAPCPEGLAYLGYQKAGISYAFERPATLFGDEPGLGKTIQAIGIINCSPDAKRILVICPASLKSNWRIELTKWLVRKRTVFVADGKLCPELADGIVVINYDVLSRHKEIIKETEWDILIVDEAHFCKSAKSLRSRMVLGARATKKEKEAGMADIPGIMAKKKLLLTGTPICNKPIELYPLIHYLDPITWGSYWKYAARYTGASNENGWSTDGAQNMAELQDRLRSTIMVRRLKKDVLTELPPKTRKIVEIPADASIRALLKQESAIYDEEAMEEAEERAEMAKASDNPDDYKAAVGNLKARMKAQFDSLSTLRKELAIAKMNMPVVHELIEEALEESNKLIIFIHHKECARILSAKFGAAACMIVGDTSMPDRQAAVDRFQKDPSCKVIIGSIGAMGVGLTLTASSRVLMLELDWVPGNVSQAEDRAHRIGQRDNVLVEHYVVEGSLDAVMAKRLIAKQEIIDAALDDITKESDIPAPRAGGTRATFDQIAREASGMTADQRNATVTAIRQLAEMCDGAANRDGAGFNKIDAGIGRSLASAASLTPKQIALARKIAVKYARQLSPSLVERMKGTP